MKWLCKKIRKVILTICVVLFFFLIIAAYAFQKYVRPNHYQYLFPYTRLFAKQLITTQARKGLNGELQVFIPEGEAILGFNGREIVGDIPSFWIDQRLVTVKQYQKCVSKNICARPHYRNEYSDYDSTYWKREMPVVFISWYEAQTYCEMNKGHLPTEAQWEKAARGFEGRTYLWKGVEDNDKDYHYANFDNFFSGTVPSGWLWKGTSPYGVLDMMGNVREWVLDSFYDDAPISLDPWKSMIDADYYYSEKTLKGGSYSDDLAHIRPYWRDIHDGTSPGVNRGFRCAYEIDDEIIVVD